MSPKSHKLKIQPKLASKLLLIFLAVWFIGAVLTILSQWVFSDNFHGSPFQTKYLKYFWPVIIDLVSGHGMLGAELHLVSKIIAVIVVITEIIIFAVSNGLIVSMFIHVQQRDGQNSLSSKSHIMQSKERKVEQIKKVLSLFTKNKIPGLDVNHCYCWDNQGSFVSVNNPIDTSFKFSSLGQVQHVRLLLLLILPRKNNKTGALELLFKKHKDWKYVFPSLEITNHTSISKSELESEITARLREVVNVGSISNIVYLGGVMSFKKSPTNFEANCYIFPFYVLRGTLTEDDIEDLAKGGKFFTYLSKGAIESIKDIFTMPNGDVYRALERLYSGWGSFWKYVYEYDVALSFAGEDRGYVEKVADELKEKGVSVFYDKFEEENLWGKDLYTYLSAIYHNKAAHTIIFISEHYKRKLWTNHERKSAQARSFSENEDFILPARFDDTEIPGILPTKGYIDLRGKSPSQLTELVCKKINHV